MQALARDALLTLMCPEETSACSRQYTQPSGLTSQLLIFANRVLWAVMTGEAPVDAIGCLTLRNSPDSPMHGQYIDKDDKRRGRDDGCANHSATCFFRNLRGSHSCAQYTRSFTTVEKQAARATLRRLSRYTVTGELVQLLFTPSALLDRTISFLQQQLPAAPADVSVHVRRGDKLTTNRPLQMQRRVAASELATIVQRAIGRSSAATHTPTVHLMSDDTELAYDLAVLLPRWRVLTVRRLAEDGAVPPDEMRTRQWLATRASNITGAASRPHPLVPPRPGPNGKEAATKEAANVLRRWMHQPCGLPSRWDPHHARSTFSSRLTAGVEGSWQPALPPCATGAPHESRPDVRWVRPSAGGGGAMLLAELHLMARSRHIIASSGSGMGILLLSLAEGGDGEQAVHFSDLEEQLSNAALGAGTFFCDLPFGWRWMCGPGGVTCHPEGNRPHRGQHDGERPLFRRACDVPAGSTLVAAPDWADAWRVQNSEGGEGRSV